MAAKNLDYFSTFLETLGNSAAGQPTTRRPLIKGLPAAEALPDLETLVSVFPARPGSLSLVDLARTLGLSLSTAALAMRQLSEVGLVENDRGAFRLTEVGAEAAKIG